jgi:undecaprenyl-diphosphatase
MLSSALALSLVVALWHTRFRWLAIVLGALYIALIGFTRLYLGVHYPTDVAGGWLASLLWVMALAVVYQRARR